MKRQVAALVAAIALLACGNAARAATEVVGIYTITYDLYEDGVSLNGITPKPEGAFAVPDTLGGQPVRAIGGAAFIACGVTSVVIPPTVTSIGASAFWGCDALNAVTIPDSVSEIAMNAFQNTGIANAAFGAVVVDGWLCGFNSGMTPSGNVTLPSGWRGIAAGAFRNNSDITGVTVPGSVRHIGSEAFSNCKNLTSVTLSEGLLSIGYSAFSVCGSLANAPAIPGSVTRVGEYAFTSTRFYINLPSPSPVYAGNWLVAYKGSVVPNPLVIAAGTVGIADGALRGLRYPNSEYVFPSSLGTIGREAFAGNQVRALTLPEGYTAVGPRAFAGCEIRSIAFLGDVTEIGWEAFDGCQYLTGIHLSPTVANVGKRAFRGCRDLAEATLPCAEYGTDAFQNCNALSHAVIVPGAGSTAWGDALAGRGGLQDVEIRGGVSEIGAGAFEGCATLGKVVVAAGVATVGDGAFGSCPLLEAVYFKGDAPKNAGAGAVIDGLYDGSPNAVNYVRDFAKGWDGDWGSAALPPDGLWHDRPIAHFAPGDEGGLGPEGGDFRLRITHFTVEDSPLPGLTVTRVRLYFDYDYNVPNLCVRVWEHLGTEGETIDYAPFVFGDNAYGKGSVSVNVSSSRNSSFFRLEEAK